MKRLAAIDVEEVENLKTTQKLLYSWMRGVRAEDLDVSSAVFGRDGLDELACWLEEGGGRDVLVEGGNIVECI